MATDPTPEPAARPAGGPPAMTPYAIAVALFAAFVVGEILGRAVPAWVVVLVGVVVGAAVFVFVDRYPGCPGADGRAGPDALASPGRSKRSLSGAAQVIEHADFAGAQARVEPLWPWIDRLWFRRGRADGLPSVWVMRFAVFGCFRLGAPGLD